MNIIKKYPNFTKAGNQDKVFRFFNTMPLIREDLFSDATVTGSITAINGEVGMNISGYRGVAYTLTGTWTATVQAQISTNDGVTWVGVDSYRFSTEAPVISPTVNAVYAITELRGANRVRVTATAFTSGTITVAIRATMADTLQQTKYDGVTGSGVPPHAAYVGGQAKVSALPTAITDATTSPFMTDKFGRALVLPYTIRDLTSTGYAALTRVAESTVIAGVAGSFLDLVQVTATNTSTNAIGVTIRSVTAGNTEDTLVVPAGGSFAKTFAVPLPQNNSGNNWTAQTTLTGDISDSPVTVSMIAVQNL